ncbi:MAG: outer membrane protein assembly factor BamA [Flavobacteriales bacterium]
MPKLRHALLVLICLTAVLDWNTCSAQIGGVNLEKPATYRLEGLTVLGAEYTDVQAIKVLSDLPVGREITVPGERTKNAIKNLWASRLFDDITLYAAKVDGDKIYLVIEVSEMPRCTNIDFGNLRQGERSTLIDKIDFQKGTVLTENWMANAKNIIKAHYKEKGFYNAKVEMRTKEDKVTDNSLLLFVDVKKGARIKIGEIVFNDATEFPERKLRGKLKETKRKRWYRFLKTSKLIEDDYEVDKSMLTAFYNDKGYKNFKIESDSVYLMENGLLGLQLNITEGNKFYFGDIQIYGNSKYNSDTLKNILKIKPGDEYNQSLLDSRVYMNPNGLDISSIYMDQGYLNFQPLLAETSVKGDTIDLEIRIYEGKQYRVGDVTVVGNDKTNDHVIYREIRTRPGDLFSRTNIIRTQRELSNLGYFAPEGFDVQIKQNEEDGTVDLTYVVEERPSDQIQLSGGFGAGRVVGTLGLSFSNFSARNMFKKGAWKPIPTGDGQRLSIQGQSNGVFFQSLSASFTEPWLGGKKPNSLSLSYSRTRVSNGVDRKDDQGNINPALQQMRLQGGSVGFGTRLRVPDDYFLFLANVSYQRFDLFNYQQLGDLFQTGIANNLSFGATLQRNSVSEPIYPTYGSTIKLSVKATLPYSLLRSDDFIYATAQDKFRWVEYHKTKFTIDWYTPLSKGTDEKPPKLILNTKAGFGFLGFYNDAIGASPFERFYVGGVNLNQFGLDGREIIYLRGYPESSISGGNGAPLVAKYTAELRYPISTNPQATIYTLAFAEAGNTWENFRTFNPFQVKRSAGIGLRVFLPMFGLLGLDYGWRFDDLDGPGGGSIEKTQLHFSIGMNIGDL